MTLKGMFLMTIAVGIISSSAPWPSAPGMPGVVMFGSGGEPPPEERSELLGGERERLSGYMVELSSHCWRYAQKLNMSMHLVR